jgi:hypothetical protein
LQVLFGLKIKDVTNFRFRMTFNNGKRTTLNSKNRIEKTSRLKNTNGTGNERAKGFIPKVQLGKANPHQWEKGAIWVVKDGQ